MESIKPATYALRRKKLTTLYGDSLFILPSQSIAMRSHIVAHPYHGGSDLIYLIGRASANMCLVLFRDQEVLFYDTPNDEDKAWDDSWIKEEELYEASGIKKILPSSELFSYLEKLLKDCKQVAVSLQRNRILDQWIFDNISYNHVNKSSTSHTGISLVDSKFLIGGLRLKKDRQEIDCLKKAADVSSQAHNFCMSQDFIGKSEIQIAREIENNFYELGGEGLGYQTIVGGGSRATIIHALPTERIIKESDLILVDAAAQYQGYTADITRTFPANHNWTKEQKEIYQVVLRAQLAAIDIVKPGVTLSLIHQTAERTLIKGLEDLGFKSSFIKESFHNWFPHSTSHWLGLDVHDPCPYVDEKGQPLILEEGMCFTIEPGLYFEENFTHVQYSNLGVRIEDDILVTDKGYEVLSSKAKK